jgi:hypothetical protein
MDGGGLGLQGGANLMAGRDILMEGVQSQHLAGGGAGFQISPPVKSGVLYFFVASPKNLPKRFYQGSGAFLPIGDHWGLIRMSYDSSSSTVIVLPFDTVSPLFLTHIFHQPSGQSALNPLDVPGALESIVLPDIDSQWIRSAGSVALPIPESKGVLMLLASHGRDDRETVSLRISPAASKHVTARTSLCHGWNWYLIQMEPAAVKGMSWVDLKTDPPWAPGLSAFPEDLGIRVAVIGVTDQRLILP